MSIKVKRETKLIMEALERFLEREDVANKKVTQVLPQDQIIPNDPSFGEFAGKRIKAGTKINAPLWSIVAGFFHKIPKKKIAEILDNYNFIVKPFIEELYHVLNDYYTSQKIYSYDDEESLKKVVRKRIKEE